jgi:hypothetical protein
MGHADDALLGLLAAITLLLAAFIAAVILANPDDADSPAQLAPSAAGPADTLPARQPPTLPPPPIAQRQDPRLSPRTPTSDAGRPFRVGAVFVVGLIIAAIGAWLFLSPGPASACTNQAAVICAQGYVLLTRTQILGGAVALAGIALIFTAALLALREQN